MPCGLIFPMYLNFSRPVFVVKACVRPSIPSEMVSRAPVANQCLILHHGKSVESFAAVRIQPYIRGKKSL